MTAWQSIFLGRATPRRARACADAGSESRSVVARTSTLPPTAIVRPYAMCVRIRRRRHQWPRRAALVPLPLRRVGRIQWSGERRVEVSLT